jgi:alkanesulfonate monooxygenase SsuD/methylene tetrahydromethanopterin reductase-like flavin-dependent oxidoreductase (luciferase family)
MQLSFGTNRFYFLEPSRLIESCRQTEAVGFDHLWFPDSQLHVGDVFVNLLTAAQHTERASVGTLIVNPVTRHPSVIAGSIAGVDAYVPGRVKLGVAAGDTGRPVGLLPPAIREAYGFLLDSHCEQALRRSRRMIRTPLPYMPS